MVENDDYVCLQTELGDLLIVLYSKRAPVTVENFLRYVDQQLFRNRSFFRIVTLENQTVYSEQNAEEPVKIQVIQGGLDVDHKSLLAPIQHESTEKTGIPHQHGVLSMSRLDPGSATGSFFICIGDQPELDHGGRRYADGLGFAAFGRVSEGYDVLDRLFARAEPSEYLARPIRIRAISLALPSTLPA